jgi:hypothetical protein
MTSPARILDPQEIEATNAGASLLMKEGMRLAQSGHDMDALPYFGRA